MFSSSYQEPFDYPRKKEPVVVNVSLPCLKAMTEVEEGDIRCTAEYSLPEPQGMDHHVTGTEYRLLSQLIHQSERVDYRECNFSSHIQWDDQFYTRSEKTSYQKCQELMDLKMGHLFTEVGDGGGVEEIIATCLPHFQGIRQLESNRYYLSKGRSSFFQGYTGYAETFQSGSLGICCCRNGFRYDSCFWLRRALDLDFREGTCWYLYHHLWKPW